MFETYFPDAEIALQLPKRVYPIFSCYNGKTLNFSQFFHCKNGFSNHVFTIVVVRTLILDVYIVKFEQKKIFVQKERVQLNRSQDKSNFTRKLANFYLLNVASIRFSAIENVVLDENILKIGRKN